MEVVGLMKTHINKCPCYGKLVKEFIMNISSDCNVEGSEDYIKEYYK